MMIILRQTTLTSIHTVYESSILRVNTKMSNYIIYCTTFFKMAEQEAMFTLADGSVSTAEPRPNAYIPTEEHELPIPRPYGRHAPFKPTEAGSTMRHIRKPMPKPIEL